MPPCGLCLSQKGMVIIMKAYIKKTIYLILSVIMLFLFIEYNNKGINQNVIAEDVSIADPDSLIVNFLNVGMGDCTFIQYNDVQILVDSGEVKGKSEQGLMNAEKIISFIRKSFTGEDKTLDYVVVTHGDSDHLGNMSSILDSFDNENYFVGTIIDFDSLYYEAFYQAKYHPDQYERNKIFFDSKCNIFNVDTNNSGQVEESYHSDLFGKYKKSRDKLIAKSTKYYCVAERMNNFPNYTPIFSNDNSDSNLTNKNSIFKLGKSEDSPILRVLYNLNYFDLLDSSLMEQEIQGTYSDYAYYVNTKSVCLILTWGSSKVLLTGDLEETHDMCGESNLIKTYNNVDGKLLKNITLYKAAHHGSETSNSSEFIKEICPKYVAISAVANSEGNTSGEYWNFPRQSILENFLSVTDNIYITSYYNDSDGINDSYYGTITFSIDNKENVKVTCSAKEKEYNSVYANGTLKKLIDTDWFIDNRYLPLNVYVLDGYESSVNAYLGNCTLIKYGKIDILIDCGVFGTIGKSAINTDCFINKINKYCLDGRLEYVIVTSPYTYSIQQMVDIKENGSIKIKGILSSYKIDNLIDFGLSNDPSHGAYDSLYKSYKEKKANLIKEGTDYYTASSIKNKPIKITDDLSLNILNNPYYENVGENQFESAVCCYIQFCGKKLLFMGNVTEKGEKAMVDEKSNDFSNVIFFNTVDYGYSGANSSVLLDKIKNNKERLYITINSIANENIFGKKNLTKGLCDRLISCSQFCYLNMELNSSGKYREICGDITFSIKSKNGQIVGNPSLVGSKGTNLLQYSDYYKRMV